MSRSQISKFVNSGKGDGPKVLVFNVSFNGEDRSGNRLQTSPLHRLVIECHAPLNGQMTTLEGNIPIGELPAMLSLSEQALHNHVIYRQDISFDLLPGIWKPRMNTTDGNGNTLVYSFEAKYNSKLNFPVCITLSNAYTRVEKNS